LPGRRRLGIRKRPRCWRGSVAREETRGFLEDARAFRESARGDGGFEVCDIEVFLARVCRLKPFAYQLELAGLYRWCQFLAVRWPRQTGKSTLIAGLMLQDAYEIKDLNVAFVGPSFRQTKMNLLKVAGFCRNLPVGSVVVKKTRICFGNGSSIEAFPNNPDTIRGNTFDQIWWDETNFTSGDQELYSAILFTLTTTKGKLVTSSTPFNSDSLFWKMCNHKSMARYVRHHFTYEKALAPLGPLNAEIVDAIKQQLGDDQQRWRREMEAEWAEDEDVWLPQSLIVSCVGTSKNCGVDLVEFKPNLVYEGEFFAGLDLAQTGITAYLLLLSGKMTSCFFVI
jgi:hypothetical protein